MIGETVKVETEVSGEVAAPEGLEVWLCADLSNCESPTAKATLGWNKQVSKL